MCINANAVKCHKLNANLFIKRNTFCFPQIGYGPHPTPSDLHAIIGAIEPNHIHPIGPILFDIECYNGFPSYLANLCKDMERFRTTRDIAGAIDESDALNLYGNIIYEYKLPSILLIEIYFVIFFL